MSVKEIKNKSVSKTLAVALLVGLLAAVGLSQAAQPRGATLGEKIERTLKAKDPMWRLNFGKKAGDNTKQVWGYGKDSVTVSIFEKATAEEAAAALKASASSVSGAEARKSEGLGDEAYLITSPADPRPERGEAAGVMFRKGSVLVYVNARSHGSGVGMVRLFAQHVADQIAAD